MDLRLSPKLIPLHGYHGVVRDYAMVDHEDGKAALQHRWSLSAWGYAVRLVGLSSGKKVGLRLHRWLLGLEPGDPRQVDHINRVKLDNRRENLRIVPEQGCQSHNTSLRSDNRSGYRGVGWAKREQKWRARVMVGGRDHHVGYFDSKEDAAVAAKKARKRLLLYAVD